MQALKKPSDNAFNMPSSVKHLDLHCLLGSDAVATESGRANAQSISVAPIPKLLVVVRAIDMFVSQSEPTTINCASVLLFTR